VILEPLTAAAFEPYGHVVSRPERAPDASAEGWSWWAQAAALPPGERPYAVGYLELQPAEAVVDWAEHHARSVELILPLGGDCAVYVAAAGVEPRGFRAFRLRAGEGVVLDPGIWHGAPVALEGTAAAAVLLPEGTGSEDTVVVRFPDSPIRIEV
jgi:ureidoglycolate lyase